MIIKPANIFAAALFAALSAAPDSFAVTSGAPALTNAAAKPADKLVELFGDPVLARGKGLEIKRSELDVELVRAKAAAASGRLTLPPDLEPRVLDQLIGVRLVLSQATDADRAKAKELFDKSYQTYKTDRKLTDEEFNTELRPQLQLQRLTREEWEKQRIDQATIPVVLERELKVVISDDEAKKFYDSHPARFEQPEMVHVRQILLRTLGSDNTTPLPEDKRKAKRKLMEDLLKRARDGEDFAKLAKEYSEDAGSKENGGEATFPRGWFGPQNPRVMPLPEFESAAFSLNTNQVSDIVTTMLGYHIVKLIEKIPAKTVEYDKVVADLKEGLKTQELQKQLPGYITRLKAGANIEILDEKLKLKQVEPLEGAADPLGLEKPGEKKAEGGKVGEKK